MRTRNILLVALAGFIIITLAAAFFTLYRGPAVRCKATLSRRHIRIGDRITYAMKIVYDKGVEVEAPDFKEKLLEFEIANRKIVKRALPGKNFLAEYYVLTRYKPGQYVIPASEVNYRDKNGDAKKIKCNEVRLLVKSVLGDDIKSDFKTTITGDLGSKTTSAERTKGTDSRSIDMPIWFRIFEISGPLAFFTYREIGNIAALGTAVILGILLTGFLLKRMSKKQVKLSAYDLATERLRALEEKKSSEEGFAREFFFELSSILRGYIKTTLILSSSELTPKEFLAGVDKLQSLSRKEKDDVRHIFSLCDIVKFSGFIPEKKEVLENLAAARELVDRIHSMTQEEKTNT